MTTNRRQFLQSALGASAVVSLGATAPRFLLQAAAAAEGAEGDQVLVVVQLSGGNDGLNTVIPVKDAEYYKRRPTLAISETRAVRINDELGLHPALDGFASLLEAGRLAIVQGVGYDRPNRSHFESMDIWHTCRRKNETRDRGWLGGFLDATGASGGDVPALHLGSEKQPLALAARDVAVPSVGSLDQFRLRGAREEVLEAVRKLSAAPRNSDGLLSFVQSNSQSALAASQRVQQAASGYEPKAMYPETPLGDKLRTVAQLIDAGMKTRIYYVELGGFDTHAQQDGAHTSLLRQLGGAVDAFIRDLQGQGHLDRVLLLSFSEFGRRVAENASEGTDHGAAAPAFLAGGRVKAGVHGAQPSLTDLEDGDLKFHTDFRRLYATALESWLKFPSADPLGGQYEPLPVLKG